MYISKANRIFIDELRAENKNINLGSDNQVMSIITKTNKAAKEIITQRNLKEILDNDPLGLLG